MDTSRFRDIVNMRRMDRRAFNAGLASLGLAMVTVPVVPTAAQAAGDMTYFTWAGYEIPELHPSYVEKYGGSPETAFFADEEEAFLKLRNGFAADVAHPCSTNISRWHDGGVIKTLDPSRLTYWDNLIPALRDMPGASIDGQPLFIPNDWGSHSVAYRSDLIDPAYAEENGWNLLVDDTFAGRLGMWDSVEAAVAFAAVILGIKDTTNVTDAQIGEMKAVLARQKELLRTYWGSETEAEGMLASGELAACYLWSGPIFRLQEQGIPVEYMMNPKGGIISWVCGLVMTTTGEGDDQAVYDFLNAWTSPAAGKFLVEVYGYGHANSLTYDDVDPTILESMGLSGDITEYLANSSPFRSWEPTLLERYVAMFEDVKLGV
jgi:spermidine/putrescine transport system substrate-binding protein